VFIDAAGRRLGVSGLRHLATVDAVTVDNLGSRVGQ
jgi:hypothetical protein